MALYAALLAVPLLGVVPVLGAPRPVPATVSVTPSSVAAGAVNTLQFKYQANVAFAAADVTLVVPTGWTPPVTGPATVAGYVSVNKGNCSIPAPAISVSGSGPWTVTIHGVTCSFSKTFTVSYAKAASSGPLGAAIFGGTVGGVAIAPAVVNVVAGGAAKLVFLQSPGGTITGGVAFPTQPKVAITDAVGNVVTTNTSKVTLTITSGTGTAGATFSCTTSPLAAVAGVASFSGCKINKAGTGYKLHATDGSLTAADSSPFTVSAGPGAKLVFSTQPGGGTINVGVAFPTQPVVTIQDAGGNTATGDVSTVTLAITAGTGTAGAALGCAPTNSLAAVTGVATFSGCTIGLAGTGYKLHATDGALTPADSTAFNVANGAAAKLAFIQSPGGTITGGVAFPTQPKVAIQDLAGTTVTSDTSTVTLTVTPLTGTAGAAFSCTSDAKSAVSGVATFSGCKIDKAGTAYQLHATDGTLTAADSTAFDVGVGPAASLGFSVSPGGSPTGGVAFPTQPKVVMYDAGGNAVTADTSTVTLAIKAATGTAGAALDCNPVAAVAGVATFSGCAIDLVGTGYKLHATDGALTAADSDAFDVAAGTAVSMAFTGQPGNANADGPFGDQPAVTLYDAGGNVASGDVSLVTLAITDGTGDATAVLTCDPVNAIAGVATFTGCAIDKAATGYTLTASDGVLPTVDSDPFDVAAGAAASLAFTGQPGGADANIDGAWPNQPEVTLYDAHGNVAAGDDTTSVSLAITSGSGADGATLTCNTDPVSATAAAGVATFSGCTIDKPASGYTLTASVSGLTDAVSDPFDVAVGAPAQLAFVRQVAGAPDLCLIEGFDTFGCFLQLIGAIPPPGITGGAPWDIQPQVAIEDAGGNVVTTDTSGVTLELKASAGTPGAALTCVDNPVSAVAGIADFTPSFAPFGGGGCSIDLAGTGYVLHATDGTLTAADSDPFDVTVGPPAHVSLTLSPSTVTAGVAVVTPTADITVTDAGGNKVPGVAALISLSTNGGATFGTVTQNADNTYSATFDDDVAGTEDIKASIPLFGPFGPVEISDTKTLTVLADAPSTVVFTTAPFSTLAGVESDPITVQMQDEYGNPAKSASATTLNLSTDSDHGSFIAPDESVIDHITIPAGETDGSFVYVDTTVGTPTISVSNSSFAGSPFTQTETETS